MNAGPAILIMIGGFLVFTSSLWQWSRVVTQDSFVEICSESGQYLVNQTVIECKVIE